MLLVFFLLATLSCDGELVVDLQTIVGDGVATIVDGLIAAAFVAFGSDRSLF